jgi:hypothetical protein
VAAGGHNAFFSRLGHALARLEGEEVAGRVEGDDDLFAAWDKLVDRYGTAGSRFEKWAKGLRDGLASSDHDEVTRTIGRVGSELLGLNAQARKATSGEEDAYWELLSPRRSLAFEVKLAPTVKAVANKDVAQAESAVRALESEKGHAVRGLLVTPYEKVEDKVTDRLDRVRLITVDVLAGEVDELLSVLRDYRRKWDDDAQAREQARDSVTADLPPLDWLSRASESAEAWVTEDSLEEAWEDRTG